MMFWRKRTIGRVACAVFLSLVGGGYLSGSAGATDTVHLTMFIWAGSNQGVVPREVVAAYLKTHPNVSIDFVESNNTVTYPKMVAAKQVDPNNPYVDFGFFNVSTAAQGDVDGMWTPLDPKKVPNMKYVLPTYHRAHNMGIGYQTSLIGLMYNSKLVKKRPKTWTALWSPQFKGKVTTFDYQWEALVIAARMNHGSEKNINPGFKLWSKHADQFKALVNSNDQLENLIVTGQAEVAPWFLAIEHVWEQQGAPVAFVLPKEGAIAFPVYLELVKGITPQQKVVAQQIINMLLSSKYAGEYGRLTYSTPVETNAKLTKAQKNDPHLSLKAAAHAWQLNWSTIAKNDATWKQRWDQEVKSHMH